MQYSRLTLNNAVKTALNSLSAQTEENARNVKKILTFVNAINSKIEGLELYSASEQWQDLSEITEFLRDVPEFEIGEDLRSYYDETEAWRNDNMLDLFIHCVASADEDQKAGLKNLRDFTCRFIFNNHDDYEHESLQTYDSEEKWIGDIVAILCDAIADRLNVFYQCTANLTGDDLKEDAEQIEEWIKYYFESIDLDNPKNTEEEAGNDNTEE